MKNLKRWVSLGLVAAMTISMAACGSSETGDNEGGGSSSGSETAVDSADDSGANEGLAGIVNTSEPTYGGSATFYYQNFNEVFDPAMGENYTYSLWLETLWAPDWSINDPDVYNFDANVLPVEDIGEYTDTGCDLTVTIRDDVYFQEKDAEYDVFGGRNLTADDVVYSYDRTLGVGSYADKEAPDYGGMWGMVLGDVVDLNASGDAAKPLVEKVDDYTVVFHLKATTEAQIGTFMQSMINITGVEWENLTAEQQNDWHYACGTGPYILTDYQAGSYYKFKKNENYYEYDERHPENKLPYLDEVILTSVTDNAAAMSSFISGDLDYIALDAFLSDDQSAELISSMDGNLQVNSYSNGANALVLKCNQEPFSDPKVRIALQKAINLEEATVSYLGYSEDDFAYAALWSPSLTGWSGIENWSADLLDEYTYDPEGAKELLAEAGYPDGFTFTVAIDPEADPDLFQLAKSYFAAIGVTMEIEVLSDMMEGREVQGNSEDTRQFNNTVGAASDAGFAYQTWASDGFAYAVYANDTEMDELLKNTRDAMTLDDQANYAQQADVHFAEQHWAIVLSGQTMQKEYLQTRIRGLENGELLSGHHFFKTFIARIYAVD